jgi:hypothetical protein
LEEAQERARREQMPYKALIGDPPEAHDRGDAEKREKPQKASADRHPAGGP